MLVICDNPGMISMHLATAAVFTLALSAGMAPAAQTPDSVPAYVLRGKRTEANQRALREGLARFHDALKEALKRDAPDPLPKLEPPPPRVFGYLILPRVLTDTTPPPPAKPVVLSFSWGWSDTQIAQTMAKLEGLKTELARIVASGVDGAAYSALAAEYRKVVDARRPIDADI